MSWANDFFENSILPSENRRVLLHVSFNLKKRKNLYDRNNLGFQVKGGSTFPRVTGDGWRVTGEIDFYKLSGKQK